MELKKAQRFLDCLVSHFLIHYMVNAVANFDVLKVNLIAFTCTRIITLLFIKAKQKAK